MSNRLRLVPVYFFLLVTTTITFAGSPPQPTTKPANITWDNAKKHLGDTVTVTGPVMGTHPVNSGKWLILNIGKDYPDPTRLMILIKGQVAESDYKNKKISATGKVVIYEGSPANHVDPRRCQDQFRRAIQATVAIDSAMTTGNALAFSCREHTHLKI